MKKKILFIVAIVLCVAMIACVFTACDDTKPVEPDDNNTPVDTAEVPTEDGKVTFYFTLAEGSSPQEAFASYFMTGGYNGFATGMDANMFVNKEGTRIYYTMVDAAVVDASLGEDKSNIKEYQLLVGYNADSGLSGDKLGVQWVDARKCKVCAELGGLNNPTYEYEVGNKTVNLGEQEFTISMEAPLKISTTLKVVFDAAIPEGAKVALCGAFNNWGNDADRASYFMTTEDNINFSMELVDVLTSEYEFKMLVFAPTVYVEDQESIWTGAWQYGAAGVSELNAGNAKLVLAKGDAGEEVNLFGAGKKVTYKEAKEMNFTFVVNFDEVQAEGIKVSLMGSMNNWTYSEENCAMTTEDGQKYTITFNGLALGSYDYKVIVGGELAEDGSMANVWGNNTEYGVIGEDGKVGNANIVVTDEMAGTEVELEVVTVAAAPEVEE